MPQATMNLIMVPTDLCDYPTQPRTWTDAVRDYCLRLGENMQAHGQKVPVIGWFVGKRFQLADGGCRLEGTKLVGIRELLALDLGKEPTRGELLLAQASIDLHKQHLPPVDRARLYQSIMTERGFNGKQTAGALHVTESWLSRFLPLTDLALDLQEMVNSGALEWSKGSLIAQATKDFEQQRQMAKAASGMTRDALAASIRKARNGNGGKGDHETVKVTRIKCTVPGRKATITISGQNISLSLAVDIVAEWLKEARRAAESGVSAKSFERVCKEKAAGH